MTRRKAQIAFDEQALENSELADLLDDREEAKFQLRPYLEKYRGLDKGVKGKIEQLELSDGTYRCGSFTIKLSQADETHIEFERTSTRRISIKPVKEQ